MNGQKEKSLHKAVKESEEKILGAGANIGQKVEMLSAALEKGGKKVREVGASINQNFKKNPWSFLTGMTIVSLVVGFIMGKSRKV